MKAFLIATDHVERDLLTPVLRHAGLDVAGSGSLNHVMSNWHQNWADLIVSAADTGSDLAADVATVRAVTNIPLLILSDPLPVSELSALLRAGADLVLERPVSPRVLVAYAQVFVRRSGVVPAFVLPTVDSEEIALEPGARTARIGEGKAIRLTQLEFWLLYLLMTNRDQVIPVDVIVERVWGHSGRGDRDLVRGLVSRLRRKIEPDPHKPRFVHTIPGVGYRFSLDAD